MKVMSRKLLHNRRQINHAGGANGWGEGLAQGRGQGEGDIDGVNVPFYSDNGEDDYEAIGRAMARERR